MSKLGVMVIVVITSVCVFNITSESAVSVLRDDSKQLATELLVAGFQFCVATDWYGVKATIPGGIYDARNRCTWIICEDARLVAMVVQIPERMRAGFAAYLVKGLPDGVMVTSNVVGIAIKTTDEYIVNELVKVMETWSRQTGMRVNVFK